MKSFIINLFILFRNLTKSYFLVIRKDINYCICLHIILLSNLSTIRYYYNKQMSPNHVDKESYQYQKKIEIIFFIQKHIKILNKKNDKNLLKKKKN